MVAALLLMLQAGLTVTTETDRDRVPIGDEVQYLLRATSGSTGAFRVELPQLRGLEIVERSERLDSPVTSTGVYSYELAVTFRATEVGAWRIGPVMVFHGLEIGLGPELTVTVLGNAANDPNRNARLLSLIRQVPPPTPGSPAALAIVVSDDEVVQGAQLDVLTAAWFSRSLRNRLRRPPTLKPPVLAGVWTVPQPAIPGIISSRAVGDDVYDLFVSHQVAFPLTPGTLTVPPARLEYAVPVTRRASGDERPEAATSRPVAVRVLAPPDDARPAGFQGPAARGLRIGYRVRELPGHTGEPLPVDVWVQGTGNLAFWPPPSVTWPRGVRAYLDRTNETPEVADGLLGGTKVFHFLLVSDSVGSVALPALDYDYFDPAGRRYLTAGTAGMVVPILAGKSRVAGRTPPPLAPPAGTDPLRRLAPGRWEWFGLLAVPLALAGLLGLVRRVRARGRQPESAPGRIDGVAALEQLIAGLVAEADRGDPAALSRGLRAAGIDRAGAAETARLKAEIDRLRFTPGDSSEVGPLGRDAAALIARLPGRIRRRAGVLALLLVAGTAVAAGQERPESLYRQGAFGPAAAGFAARSRAFPRQWAHWYDQAAARYLAGDDAAAAALLTTALEVAPRARPARRLWNELERQYEPLRATRPRPGLSAGETGVAALILWWLAIAVAVFRRGRIRAGALVVGAAAVLAALALTRPPEPGRAFTATSLSLRRSPHGLAPEAGALPALTRVVVERHQGEWALVRDRLDNRGWVPAASLAGVERID